MNNLLLEEEFQVSVHDCSPKGMRTYAILRHIQDIADRHASLLGISVKNVVRMGYYWVIVNVRLELVEPMPFETPIKFCTWPLGASHLLAHRAYEGRHARGGHLLFAATTDFILLEQNTKRPVNLSETPFSIPFLDRPCHVGKPVRQKPLPRYMPLDSVNVRYSSIDVNGHVNNTEYVRWGMDALRTCPDFHHRANQIEVTFSSEVYENERLNIMYTPTAPKKVAILGRSNTDERDVFLMQASFDEDDKWE